MMVKVSIYQVLDIVSFLLVTLLEDLEPYGTIAPHASYL
jgi:hypothetical protein